jgi:hypothetical protein
VFICPKQKTLKIKALIGVLDAQDLSVSEEIKDNSIQFPEFPEKKETIAPLLVWEYSEIIARAREKYGVSFLVCRKKQVYQSFSEDNNFRLVLNNGNVAIFQVVK